MTKLKQLYSKHKIPNTPDLFELSATKWWWIA